MIEKAIKQHKKNISKEKTIEIENSIHKKIANENKNKHFLKVIQDLGVKEYYADLIKIQPFKDWKEGKMKDFDNKYVNRG